MIHLQSCRIFIRSASHSYSNKPVWVTFEATSSMRDSELAAIEALSAWISARLPLLHHSWTAGADPPDFELTLGSTRYAVEVTRAVVPVNVEGKDLPFGSVAPAIRRLADEVRHSAERLGILSGAFVLGASPLHDLPDRWQDLVQGAIQYIADTRGLSTAPSRQLHRHRGAVWDIEKVHADKNFVEPMISFPARWEGEMRDDLARALADLSNRKRNKLSDVTQPKVLLILDSYGLADAELWCQVAATVDFSWCAAAFRVHSPGLCQQLFGADPTFMAPSPDSPLQEALD